MRMKHLRLVAVAGLACLGLAACGGGDDDSTGTATASGPAATTTAAASAKGPITLALVTYKVPGLDLLTPMTAGAQAAAKQINAAGGIGGRNIVITPCNSMFQPTTATKCAHDAISSKAVAMCGATRTSC
jgi:ABC-type sugar transport system substrate-binding protein